MEAKQRSVTVSYRRQVSDGNYGTEAAECSLQWFIEDDNDSHVDLEIGHEMLNNARDLVLDQLRGSLNANVRKAVTRSIAPVGTAVTVRTGGEDLPF